jgi:hypothetical protein
MSVLEDLSDDEVRELVEKISEDPEAGLPTSDDIPDDSFNDLDDSEDEEDGDDPE